MTTYKNIHGKKIKFLASDPPAAVAEGQVWYNGTDFKTSIFVSAWASGGNMGTARAKLAAGGTSTQTAGLVFGGASPAADAEVDTAAYDGTSWTQIADMATGRQELNGADASSTATLAICGELQPGNSNAVEEFTEAVALKTITDS